MIRATVGILASQGGFDADAQAFFDRVDTAGGTLSATEQRAVNRLVLDMKADGIWSSMKAIYPMVGASSASCAQNLKSSSFTGTFNGGWTFASTGATPNGSNGYMDTNLSSNTSLSLNDLSLHMYSRTNSNVGGDIGDKNLSGGFSGIFIRLSGIFYGYLGEVNNINESNLSSLGFYTISRRSSTQVYFYKNGSAFGTNPKTSSSSSLNSGTLDIGRANGQYADREYAFASIGDGLTDTEASDFYTAVQAFQTTLSRNV
tara:strand:- start:209 stop:985 length:777 start_codon:yes stop_codon:yes gene_type:complete